MRRIERSPKLCMKIQTSTPFILCSRYISSGIQWTWNLSCWYIPCGSSTSFNSKLRTRFSEETCNESTPEFFALSPITARSTVVAVSSILMTCGVWPLPSTIIIRTKFRYHLLFNCLDFFTILVTPSSSFWLYVSWREWIMLSSTSGPASPRQAIRHSPSSSYHLFVLMIAFVTHSYMFLLWYVNTRWWRTFYLGALYR